jgi:pimeloyl-ACP methyl ester carboxylesterase
MQSIVLLHGALGCDTDLAALSNNLTKLGITTYRFSFSGHGNLPFEASFGVEQFTLELDNFIRTNKLSKPSLFGYSMGGYVALKYALLNGHKIDKLITLGTKFNWNDAVIEKETKLLEPSFLENKAPAFVQALKTKHGLNWQVLLSKTADMMKEINRKQFLADEQLVEIRNRVVLGLGDKDSMVSLNETLAVHKTLPNAEM